MMATVGIMAKKVVGWDVLWRRHTAHLLPTNFPLGIQLGSSNTWLGFHAEHEHGMALNIEGQNSQNNTVLSGLAGQAPDNIQRKWK